MKIVLIYDTAICYQNILKEISSLHYQIEDGPITYIKKMEMNAL